MLRSGQRLVHRVSAMAQVPSNPLVVVLGATGTGKSKLAVDLALRFNGEIINGDAMQLYSGLPIITNKVTEEEKQGVQHHLLGCIGLDEPTWTVGQFVPKALGAINEIRAKGKLPILVGGTHYYTQSLLFRDRLADDAIEVETSEDARQNWPILQEPTSIILEKLREVDPVMADRWHPNDRRKIQRSLEIWLKTGKPASQVYDEQRAKKTSGQGDNFVAEATSDYSSEPLMLFPTLLLWVYAEPEKLRNRLDSRVDTMLSNGLLSEVASLSNFLRSRETEGHSVDRTRGIWVSIGFKEFEQYQEALESDRAKANDLKKLEDIAIEQTKIATRQYAKRQLTWIRIKLLHALREARGQGSLFVLNGSDLEKWETSVTEIATDLTRKFLGGESLPDPQSLSSIGQDLLIPKKEYDLSQRRDLWERRYCAACDMTAVTENEWNQHIQSRRHRKVAAAIAKREKQNTDSQQNRSNNDTVADEIKTINQPTVGEDGTKSCLLPE